MREEGQISVLNGMVDTDAHPKYINTDAGHVYSRTNLRSGGSRGKKFINRKLKGTLLINTDLPTGTNKCIGWCNDTQNEAIVYFIHNSNDNHCVYRYYTKTATAEKLWYEEPDLGLEDDELRAVVVEGKVYWVNGSQAPKGFNLDMAANYTAGLTDDAYTADDIPFVDNIFTLIKRPPQFAPKCVYDSDENYNFNNLRKKLFQFKYCFQYKDKQRSAWSSISKIPLPVNEILADGTWIDDITINNRIEITINTGGPQVEKILIAARDTYPNNAGSFFLFETIDKVQESINDNTTHTVYFYNNKRTETIDTTVNNRYCDHVPLSGNDILLLDQKYLAIAYPKQGYDNLADVDYDLTAIETPIDIERTEEDFAYASDVVIAGIVRCGVTTTWSTIETLTIPGTFYPNALYTVYATFGVGLNIYPVIAYYVTGSEEPANFRTTIRDGLYDQFYAKMGDCKLPYSDIGKAGDYSLRLVHYQNSFTAASYGKVMSPAFQVNYKSLKRGQYHPFGLIYNDDFGRYNIVEGENELYSPLIGEDNEDNYIRCGWEINHAPPQQAITYRWCYIKNKSYTYTLYLPYVRFHTIKDNDDIPANKYLLLINQTLEEIKDLFPNNVISSYVWINGDRLRIIGNEESYEILKEYTPASETDDNETGFLVDEIYFDAIENHDDRIPLIEIYRPNSEPQETIYLEIGEEFEIGTDQYGNKYHKGDINDQEFDVNGNLVTPASGIFDFGDVYFRERIGSDSNIYMVEDSHFSDYYISNAIDIGRVGAKIDSEQKYLNRVVRSENYLENTEYNLLNVWLPGTDYFDASDEFGAITGIEQTGDVLKIIQPHKETSVYVGRNYVKQGDGSDIVIASDKVFNTPNRYMEFRGTTYRKSLVSNNRYLYYFDESTGEFIRSSANGQMALSSYYRNRTYFEAKAKELREYTGEKDVIVGINNDNEEVYLTFCKNGESETFVFSEEEENKGWMYFCELYNDTSIPENFAHYGDIMFSFVDGALWIHDQTNSLNMFYGKQHYASLEFYVNKYANIVKRFKNIRISTTDNIWTIEFTIPTGLNYGNQKTTLIPAQLREREGQITSDILRNIINRNDTEDLSLLYRGQRMTGEFMKVKLSESSTDDVELREVEVKFLIST